VPARVTAAEVKALLAPYADSADDIVALAMEQATLLVDEDLASSGQSAARLRVIELNLAAHFTVVAVERGGFTYQKAGESGEGYANDRSKVKYSSTRFGQQAVTMDTSGVLAAADSPGGVAEFRVMADPYADVSGTVS
jgi:hypothetical protein